MTTRRQIETNYNVYPVFIRTPFTLGRLSAGLWLMTVFLLSPARLPAVDKPELRSTQGLLQIIFALPCKDQHMHLFKASEIFW